MLDFDRICPGCMKDNAGQSICSLCGYDSSKGNPADRLPIKFIIRDRYFVGKTLFTDSQCTVYLGFDTIGNRTVNIKEYFPQNIAKRGPDKSVFVSREAQFAYNEGLLEFIKLNKQLTGLSLACLPDTYTVFEENSTAYAICDTISGITLKSFVARNGGIIKWEQIRPLILPLIDTLKALHEASIIHGAVSPETVIACRDGKLRFYNLPVGNSGAKKDSAGYAVTPDLYPGYSAAEQYGVLRDGAGGYTDVYGVCATIFTVITGIIPPPADNRLKGDTLKIPAHFADELPRQVLVSLANGMQVKPAERTQSIEVLKNELIYGETRENMRKASRAAEVKQQNENKINKEEPKKNSGLKYAAIASGITAGLFLIAAVVLVFTVFKDQVFKKAEENRDNASMPSIQQIGDYDSDAVESKLLYVAPDLCGKYYVEVADSKDYVHYDIVIKGKEYSNTYERGKICAQSVEAGTQHEHGTTIEITISLGTSQVKMPSLVGLKPDRAVIELLKAGFFYKNIELVDEYDADSPPNMVLRQYPESGKAISPELSVRVFYNSYTGTDQDETSSDSGSIIG